MSASEAQPVPAEARQPWAPTVRGSSFWLGSLLDMREDPLGLMTRAAQVGDIVRFRFVHRWAHLVTSPHHAKHVLVDRHRTYDKQTPGWKSMRLALGQGLLTSEGELWRRQRRIAQPAFHHKSIASFAEIMQSRTLQMLDRWEREQLETFDLDEEMMRLTLQIVGLCLFGTDLSDDSNVVSKALAIVLPLAMDRPTRILQAPLWVPTPTNRELNQAIRDLDQIVFSIIAHRRALSEAPHDLLSMLMHAKDEETGETMSDRQLRDELVTLVLAGHETTSNALTWTFGLLSDHPEARARLEAELDQVLGGRAPTLEDLPKLEYTEAVIKESMRLRPPAWLTGRRSVEEDEIGGYHIPAGSLVFIFMYGIHRDPRYWREPERFDPERFLSGEVDELPKHAYMPFGAGPRICIGNAFAMMEAKLLLATIAQRFRLSLTKGFSPQMSPLITLRPKHGMSMTLEKRRGLD